jgi:hypothetical protein
MIGSLLITHNKTVPIKSVTQESQVEFDRAVTSLFSSGGWTIMARLDVYQSRSYVASRSYSVMLYVTVYTIPRRISGSVRSFHDFPKRHE